MQRARGRMLCATLRQNAKAPIQIEAVWSSSDERTDGRQFGIGLKLAPTDAELERKVHRKH
jgi:hypothetical protein